MTEAALAAGRGLQRAIWSAILERDIDLMLVDLLYTSRAFRAWLLARVADDLPAVDPVDGFLGAFHSVTTPNGESDIEAEWQLTDGGRLVVLLEDKVGAAFQPEQGTRYRERAANYVASGRASRTRIVLVAPAAYPRRDPSGAAPFERHLALEALAEWCRTGDAGERGTFLARFLEQALRRAIGGGRATGGSTLLTSADDGLARGGKPQFPAVYGLIEEILRLRTSVEPQLAVSSNAPGEWVYFAFDGRGKRVSLRWRIRDHWAELVLNAALISRQRLDEVLARRPLAGAAVAARGTSEFVVWVPTPELDLLAEPDAQREAIGGALAVVAALATWYGDARPELEAGDAACALGAREAR